MNLSDKILDQQQESSAKRKELIQALRREAFFTASVRLCDIFTDAADMLYADEQEIKGWREGQSQRVELSEDQRENISNQVELQKIINAVKQAVSSPV